ncbi:Transient receptor putative cation channel sub V member 6 [Physocladia obscura]|uniref:Transient receptor putative cation channel sub V member 6 n=1 Tax=Physocladia obscura TaxID=109957 RepID=A0AAD5XEF3_9FUNG|nr:Transient receptor putative cation channel sub V member 6 [Physocladia obscura]
MVLNNRRASRATAASDNNSNTNSDGENDGETMFPVDTDNFGLAVPTNRNSNNQQQQQRRQQQQQPELFAQANGMNALTVAPALASVPANVSASFGSAQTQTSRRGQTQINLFKDNNLWQSCVEGRLEDFQRFATQPFLPLSESDSDTDSSSPKRRGECERGAEGETVLHVAVLFKHEKLIFWLVKEFPTLINDIYIKHRYLGETALHVAVVNAGYEKDASGNFVLDKDGRKKDDLSIVKLLVENGANVNGPLVFGSEFHQDQDMGCLYYGQSILQFAASNKKDDIVKYLVENEHDPADLTTIDFYGNNVLHVLTYHGNFNMSLFRYLQHRNLLDRKKNPTIPDITRARNKSNMTCFQVGISRKHIITLEAMKEIIWEFGFARQYKVLLDDIDPLQTSDAKHAKDSKSAIELAVDNNDKEILSHPLMQAVLKIKWSLYCRKSFLYQFTISILLVLFFTTCISLQPSSLQDRRNYTVTDDNRHPIPRLVFEVLSLIGTIVVVFGEFHEIYVQKWKYFTNHGASQNIVQWTLSLMIWGIVILRWVIAAIFPNSFQTIRDCENVLFGFAAIWGWIFLLDFGKGFESTGPLVLIFKRMVFEDFLTWIVLYAALTVGFAAALFLQMQAVPYLTVDESVPSLDWTEFPGAILWTARFIFMQAIFDDFRSSRIPAFTEFLYIIYGFVVLILLFNVLIAMLAETLKVIASDSEGYWRVQFADLLIQTDEALSPRKKNFFLTHLGWVDDAANVPNEKTNTTATESRYFIFTERDNVTIDPLTNKKHTAVETLKIIVARDRKGHPIEVDTDGSNWKGWTDDLVKIVTEGEQAHAAWWNNHQMKIPEKDTTRAEKIAKSMTDLHKQKFGAHKQKLFRDY